MSYSDDFWKHIYYSPEGSDFFPFEKNSFIDWVNKDRLEKDKFTTDDIFNKELIKVVFDADISNNKISFDTSTINTVHPLVEACKSGEVKVSCAYYESSVSAYNKSADNTFNSDSVSGSNISYNEENGITTVTYGGSTYEYGTHGGTCALHKNCTGNHLHYNNCALQTIKNADGDSMCKCVCDGGIKMGDGDGGTHTHCGTLSKKTEEDGTEKLVFTTGGGTGETITNPGTAQETTGVSVQGAGAGAGQTRDELYIIYAKYYFELYRNKFLNSNMNSTFDTSKKAVNDATTKYKREYVLLYDYITGIFFVSGFIYFMYNEKF